MDRRSARREAFCLAFEYGFDSARTADELLSLAADARDLAADEYVTELLRLLTAHADQIDDAIRPWLKGWKLERISRVARAVLRGAPILLLDEATSALDEKTEAQVLKNLLTALPDTACILTTHRPGALKYCTRLYKAENSALTCIEVNKPA